MEVMFSINWFQTFAETMTGLRLETELDGLSRVVPVKRYRRILDVGCGVGRIAGPLASRGYAVTGVDINLKALRRAQERSPGPRYVALDQRHLGIRMAFHVEYLADHVDAIPVLARLHHAEWTAITPHLTVSDRVARFQARTRRGSIPTGFVAVVNGTVVGLACLVACDLDSHRQLSPWLASVLVAPEHRGQGIGSALSERATKEAQLFGFAEAYLFTFDKQAFYRRLGWSRLEDTMFPGHPVTVMVRGLVG